MSFISRVLVRAENDAHWVAPRWENELGEFQRVSKEWSIPVATLRRAFTNGTLKKASEDYLNSLGNTNYREVKTEKDAIRLAKKYGRDIDSIFRGLREGEKIPAPIVADWREYLNVPMSKRPKDQMPVLIGGNTRLLAAKALGITPLVYIIVLD